MPSLWSCNVVLMQQSLVLSSLSVSFRLSSPSQSRLSLPIPRNNDRNIYPPLILCCSEPSATASETNSTPVISASTPTNAAPPVIKKRKRYRKQYPGESIGITEEMRFVAMKLRNLNGKKYSSSLNSDSNSEGSQNLSKDVLEKSTESLNVGETWKPTMEGFVKFLVDSQLVFNTVERIVDESNDVAYAYFRNTGLERSEGLAKDLEWFSEQDIVIPDASTAGVSYAKYLEELADRSAPLFLSHFYNIYFSHIAGGQVIAIQVSEKILEGREMEFCQWKRDPQENLKGVRENLNMLGEHWSRDEKNKCLKEAAKSFKFLGQIVRLIIL